MTNENFIWVPGCENAEPTRYSVFCDQASSDITVADFKKEYYFDKEIKEACLYVTADTNYRLTVNGNHIGCGPAVAGSDYNFKGKTEIRYFDKYTVESPGNTLKIEAKVQFGIISFSDLSGGFGGFALCGDIVFADGTKKTVETDESWDCRKDTRYDKKADFFADNGNSFWQKAVKSKARFKLLPSEIKGLTYTNIQPINNNLSADCGESVSFRFDRIYSARMGLKIEAKGKFILKVTAFEETPGTNLSPEITVSGENALEWLSLAPYSVGGITATVIDGNSLKISAYAEFCRYPIADECDFVCSDEGLNRTYNACKRVLEINRQTYHTDSPLHKEPLACTGDYYIEALMEAMCFGNMELCEFDIIKTALMIENSGGVMFHTDYSLIWVQMLADVYKITGNKTLLERCKNALKILLERFNSYIGDTGLIENPPSYMFVDWLVIDGYSMHHPPKALGQTVQCAYYYEALNKAIEIFDILGIDRTVYKERASSLKAAVNNLLFDSQKGIYFDGLNSKYDTDYMFLPENSEKRYFSIHANTLCVLYGLYDGDEKQLLRKVLDDRKLQFPQPYFCHFVLTALIKTGLFEEYGFKYLKMWQETETVTDKGLAEGWFKPEETYHFDHSHAWGGTPAYILSKVISGLEIIEPGYKEITLSPRLFELEFANLTIPTPFGKIELKTEKGKSPEIYVPKEIRCKIII